MALTCLIASLVKCSTKASSISALLFFTSHIFYHIVAVYQEDLHKILKLLILYFPSAAVGYGFKILLDLENLGPGLQVDLLDGKSKSENLRWGFSEQDSMTQDHDNYDWHWSLNKNSDFSFFQVLLILLSSGKLNFIFAWYLEHLWSENGKNLPWYFPLMASYWLGQPVRKAENSSRSKIPTVHKLTEQDLNYPHQPFLATDQPGVIFKNITKKYAKTGQTALNHVSFQFNKGQITSFLGKNGAGKSTCFKILSGMIRPTSGTCLLDNLEIDQMDKFNYADIGICPQHNILIDELSPVEHIKFYLDLKQVGQPTSATSKKLLNKQVQNMMRAVGLSKDRSHAPTGKLSGGMKRKLSVALCFGGNPKLIFLDEPTAGIDPEARREIWKLLQNYQMFSSLEANSSYTDKPTIILCTHHLDEAEILGDSICILNAGKVIASGSPKWLKQKFGKGYILKVKRLENRPFNSYKFLSILPGIKMRKMADSDLVNASFESNDSADIFSSDVDTSSKFIEFDVAYNIFEDSNFVSKLELLDQNLVNLGIEKYQISETSLNEIFCKLRVTSG